MHFDCIIIMKGRLKMKFFKKFAAVLIAAAVFTVGNIGILPRDAIDDFMFSVRAADSDIVASGECGAEGDNVTWQLDSEGTLTISGEGEMVNWTDTDSPWYDNDDIISVVIEDGVTSIGDYAFWWCASITSVIIPDGITSIGDYTFSHCKSLTSLTIPDTVKSIGNNAFYYCNSLVSITMPDSITRMGNNAFSYCTKLKKLIIAEGSKTITSAMTCGLKYYIEDVEIPDSVTRIGDEAFYEFSLLLSITLPDSVTSVGRNAFLGTLWFEFKKNNTFIIINGILLDGHKCKGDVSVPDGVKIIGDSAFVGSSLTSITIPDSVTSIGNSAFEDCNTLTSITIPDSVTSIGDSAFKDCNALTSITIPDSVTSIGDYAFSECKALTSIKIPDSVTSIGDNAFSWCGALTSVTISDSITSIGDFAFWDCKSLIKLIIAEGSKTITSKMVDGLEDYIKEVEIPDTVTSIGNSAFKDCEALTSITLPDSITSIGDYAFSECKALTSIKIPDSVTSIGESAFNGCSGLTSIVIPDTVTSIGDSTFKDCEALTSITLPDSITSIGDYAFSECKALTSIKIPDSVTSIGDNAFSWCSTLKSVTIPNSITSIESSVFEACGNLTEIKHLRNNEYTFTDNENNEIIIADLNSVKLNFDVTSTYDEITDYRLFGHLDRLQEVCTVSGEIYAVYGEEDSIIMIPKNQSLQSIEIMNEGYTFGAATIGDDDYLYVMWGKSISDDVINESLQEENIIIAKYDLNGNVIDECGLSVDFTDAQFPFDAGNANIEYSNGIIGVLYDTEWTVTRTGDGLHHQGSEFVSLDAVSMELKNFVSNNTSHSFGVSMIATENGFVAIERGDCYPRGINFTQFTKSQSIEKNCFHASGQYKESGSHQNDTHTYMGGLEKSASTYAITGKSERFYTSGNYAESNLSTGNYDVFVRIIDSTLYDIAATDLAGENRIDEANGRIADRNVIWLTECNETEKAGNVKIVTLEDGSYCVLWEKIVDYEFDSIQYVILDECGNILRRQSTIYDARLSNTSIQPIVQGDTLTWAVSDGQTDEIIWYTVNLNEYRTEPAYLLGDVNEDGSVDSSDASLVLAEYAKIQTGGEGEFTDIQYKAADVNKDDTVDSSDASKILAYYAMVSTGKKPTWD